MHEKAHEVLEAAAKESLKLYEMRVVLAMAFGHLEIYDIQTFCGGPSVMQKCRVIEAMNHPFVQTAHTILKYKEDITTTESSTVQTARLDGKTPPMAFLSYLYRTLKRETTPNKVEMKAAVEAYQLAYRYAKNQRLALELMKDALYFNQDFLSKSAVAMPMKHFVKVLDGYLSSIPRMTKDERENERIIGRRFRWNPKTKQRELPKKNDYS